MNNFFPINKYVLAFFLASIPAQQLYSIDFNNKNTQNIITLSTIVAATTYATYLYTQQPVQRIIPVKNVATEKLNFPSKFFGISTSSTQTEQTSNNNSWSRSYLDTISTKKNTIAPNYACDSWNNWKDDIDKVIHLGCSSYRISIEWSRIEPSKGNFDAVAIAHYVEIAKYCHEHNIELMCCLHHYSDPIWFLNEGGFTKEESIATFSEYCKKMYEALCPYVTQWIPISQPVAYALKGYKVGMQPPFLKDSGLETAVMLNMFKSHIAVYDLMHNMYDENSSRQWFWYDTHNNKQNFGQEPQVGLCHQIVQMKPANEYHPIDNLIAMFADRLSNQTLLRTFTDGHFQSLTPMVDIAYLPQAPNKFDFFALSYYSPLAFNGTAASGPACAQDHVTLDPIRIIDKHGMYDAIKQASKLGKPIYIVENGINPKNEAQRELLLNSYLSAISQAIADGYDVRGYMHWTLMNNYEWCYVDEQENVIQNKPDFGLYKNRVIDDTTGQLNPDFKNHDLMLKPSGLYYKNIIKTQGS